MLKLINGFACLVSDGFKTTPNEQGTGNVVALDSRFATLASFNSSQLLALAVKLRWSSNGYYTHQSQHQWQLEYCR